MIQFFRRIRQQLLKENKFSKYLLYAIGEILLVVIGILIALQINIWNENQKTLSREKVLLNSLLEDFNYNKSSLETTLRMHNLIISDLETNLHLIGRNPSELDQEMKDNLASTGFWKPGFNDGTLNSILYSDQLGLIQNSTLKKMLTFYPYQVDVNKKSTEEIRIFIEEVHWPLIDSRISLLERTNVKENYPNLLPIKAQSDYKGLLNDVRFQNMLLREIVKIKVYIGTTNFLLQETNAIIELIQRELDLPLIWEGLLKSDKTIDEVIEIVKQQVKGDMIYDISEAYINDLGYRFIRKDKQYNEALKLFKLNTELYPNSWNTYDSYGECLLKLGDIENGIKAYKKSLHLNPDNSHVKEVLSKME